MHIGLSTAGYHYQTKIFNEFIRTQLKIEHVYLYTFIQSRDSNLLDIETNPKRVLKN